MDTCGPLETHGMDKGCRPTWQGKVKMGFLAEKSKVQKNGSDRPPRLTYSIPTMHNCDQARID
ncbi:hypothetical protein CR513_16031, partial [Mucuna pruriens]